MTTDTTAERLMDGALSNINKMSEYIQTGRTEVTETGIDLLENNVPNPDVKSLQNCIASLIKAEQRVKAFTKTVNTLKTQWQSGELDESEDVIEVLQNALKEEEEKSSTSTVWEHEFMVAFVDQLKSVDPSVALNVPNTEGEDIHLMQTEISSKCPITQCEMTDPVKDKTCGHTFEKDAINALIKQSSKKHKQAKCPYPGCTNKILPHNLEANTAMARLLQRRTNKAANSQAPKPTG